MTGTAEKQNKKHSEIVIVVYKCDTEENEMLTKIMGKMLTDYHSCCALFCFHIFSKAISLFFYMINGV